jgi:capsular exopolysaccharide synthesis family protein
MSPPEIDPALVNTYTGMLDIRPIRYTRLVKVAFRSPDPSLSVRLANAHVAAYIRQGLQLRTQASGEAEKFLEEKLVGLKERLEKSEVALNRYRRDKGIISLDDKENIVVERLTDLNKRLTEAEAERIALEAQVQLIHSREYDSLPAVLNSTLIQTLKEHVGRLDGEYAQLSAQFKPGYPRLIQLQAQVEETRRRLKQEIQNVTAGLESAYLAAVTREEELRTSMEKQKAETLGLKDAAVEYAILAREVDTNRQLYDNVLQRTKEMGMVAELRTSNVSIIDKAERPLGPSSPNKRRSLLFGALLGLLGGVGLAFFFEYLDNTLKTPEEVERYLRIPNLSVVPDFFRLSRRLPHSVPKASRHTLESNGEIKEEMRQYPSPQIGVPSKQLVVSHQPASLVAEAYRILRAAMLLSRPGEPPRTILFTSATQGEGKTTTVGNTAIIFAQMGVKVLVVDTDLRRSHFHSVFGVKNQPGLAELLTGQKELHEVTQPTAIENLFAISSGATPPNPAELVGSRKMYEILAALRAQYDFIFLDSPPVMPVSDAVFLSSMVDGVIIVVGGQETPKRLVKQACLRLGAAQAKIFGVVLNRVNLYSGDYSDYYYHYYSYYHYQGSEQAVHQN